MRESSEENLCLALNVFIMKRLLILEINELGDVCHEYDKRSAKQSEVEYYYN